MAKAVGTIHRPRCMVVKATNPGDFVLTHGHTAISKGIRVVQRARFRGDRRKFAYWNHAALLVGDSGEIVEAHGHGVRKANVNREYLARQVTVVKLGYDQRDRDQAVAYALSCVGEGYDFATILGLLGWVTFGGRLVIAVAGTEICSSLVANSLVRCGPIFPRPPITMMPADLAHFYDVTPPDEEPK